MPVSKAAAPKADQVFLAAPPRSPLIAGIGGRMKIAALARQARESLGKGLEALQAGDAPERMLAVAQPLAKAMGTLVEMEAAPPALARKASEAVLAALRAALGQLQLPQNAQLPSAEAGMG